MEKTNEKKVINKKDKKTKETKKNLNTKITVSKLVSIFIVFLILLISIAFIKDKIIDYNLLVKIINTTNEKLTSDNLYLEKYIYDDIGSIFEHSQVWHKYNKSKRILTLQGETQTAYSDLNKKQVIDPDYKSISIDGRTHKLVESFGMPSMLNIHFDELSFIDKIKELAYFSNITVENLYNRTCYKVNYQVNNRNETIWFDAQTLLLIKCIDSNYDTEYIISDCNLTEEELTIDTTGYEIFDFTNTEIQTIN